MAQSWTLDEFVQVLDQRLDELMRGEVLLQDLPLALQAWFHAGEIYGREARQPEIDRLERDANLWYYRANTSPQERQAHIEQRLSQALETAPEHVWDQLEADLAVMAGRQVNIDDSVRTGNKPDGNGAHHDDRSTRKAA